MLLVAYLQVAQPPGPNDLRLENLAQRFIKASAERLNPMKLSTANLSQKLQTINPIEKMSGRLRRKAKVKSVGRDRDKKKAPAASLPSQALDADMQTDLEKRSSSPAVARQSSPATVPGFIQNSKLVKSSKGARVAFHLLLVKPWVLVVALWLVSALSAVVALEDLISPSKLTQKLPEPTVEVAPAEPDRFIDVEQGAEGLAGEAGEIVVGEGESVDAVASADGLPVWPLVTLVGGCAAGCVAISRRRSMLRMAALRAKGRGRKLPMGRARSASDRVKASGSSPARRSPSSIRKKASIAAFKATIVRPEREKRRRARKRPSAQANRVNPTGKKRVLASRSTAQQAAPQSRVSQPGKSKPQRNRQKVTRLVRRQPVVSVVPADRAHRLDWAEGSLAHDMDRRFAMREVAMQQERAAM